MLLWHVTSSKKVLFRSNFLGADHAAVPSSSLWRRNVLLHKLTTLGTKIPRHVSTGVNDTGTSVKSVSIRRHTTPAEASIRFDAFVLSVAAYLSER